MEDLNQPEPRFYEVHLLCRNTEKGAQITIRNDEDFPVIVTLFADPFFVYIEMDAKDEQQASIYPNNTCANVQNRIYIADVEA